MALISFSGLASGIDSSSLIEATIAQRRSVQIQPLEDKISSFQDENDALNELKSLLDELKSSASSFRTLNGGGISKGVASSNETVLSASASNAAAEGSYDLTVSTLASNATFSFNDRYSSTSSAINSSMSDATPAADRTVSFTVGSGSGAESVSIELTSSSTASDFVSEFNSQSDKATASLVNTGTDDAPSYAIMITSNASGTDDGSITLDSVGSEVETAGTGAFTANQLDQATDLLFSIDGVAGTITRSSNTVSDVLDGVSFTANSTGSSTLKITSDGDSTASNIEDLVEKFNAVVDFIRDNDLIERDESGEEVENLFGALAGTSLDDNILSSLRSAVSSAGISGQEVNIFADFGVTTQRDGTLAFDREDFDEALSRDSSDLGQILENFAEEIAATGGTVDQFTRFNGLIDQAITSNEEQISSANDSIRRAEDSIARQEELLVARFARLESLVSQLQGQQSALSSSISGLSS